MVPDDDDLPGMPGIANLLSMFATARGLATNNFLVEAVGTQSVTGSGADAIKNYTRQLDDLESQFRLDVRRIANGNSAETDIVTSKLLRDTTISLRNIVSTTAGVATVRQIE